MKNVLKALLAYLILAGSTTAGFAPAHAATGYLIGQEIRAPYLYCIYRVGTQTKEVRMDAGRTCPKTYNF
ncbi:hypothetical protein CJP74_03565 [Psittacicella melopsittaci]|uniref:Uncharacterized protein n=1 Tax=Psittacicella melopsittaci TaxID=2028576 RepID=A0A3A1Y674_9GAMM|nr:hypothetical protein [Psittacicella melopsittaci]RIY32786.1 hypothetical protein CJP74_03565 [Psittacicella melopsittaci]